MIAVGLGLVGELDAPEGELVTAHASATVPEKELAGVTVILPSACDTVTVTLLSVSAVTSGPPGVM